MKSPSPAQMKALQHLRNGKLIIRATAYEFLNDVSIEAPPIGYLVPQVTARKLIENRWVELKRFSARAGEYRLTTAGRALTETLCECGSGRKRCVEEFVLLSGIAPDATTRKHDWASERLLCRRCWRLVPCAHPRFKSFTTKPHAASRYGARPICQKHFGK